MYNTVLFGSDKINKWMNKMHAWKIRLIMEDHNAHSSGGMWNAEL